MVWTGRAPPAGAPFPRPCRGGSGEKRPAHIYGQGGAFIRFLFAQAEADGEGAVDGAHGAVVQAAHALTEPGFVYGAYLLKQKLRCSALVQTAYFLPMVTSITAVGLAWKLMYNKNFGIINYLLSFFGVNPIPWLEKASYSIPALVIFGIWNILPFTIILLLSGLQNIDPQYYTAARVDGSKGLRIFLRITVPLLAPTILLVCIVNTISCFKVFSELYPLFNGKPGPFNNLYTVVYYIRYAMMENRKYGIAAAASRTALLCNVRTFGTYLHTAGDGQIDYYFILGKDREEIVKQYKEL